MLADPRSDALTKNFSGQWLQTRDIATVPIDAASVLARDAEVQTNAVAVAEGDPGVKKRNRNARPQVELDGVFAQGYAKRDGFIFQLHRHDDRDVTN